MAKTELFSRQQSGGVFTIVNESLTTGNIFFVDSGSSTGGTSAEFVTDNPSQALATAEVRIQVKKFSAVVFSFHSHLSKEAFAAETSIATVISACPALKIIFSK